VLGNQHVQSPQDLLLPLEIGKDPAEMVLPISTKNPHLGIDGRDDETELDERVSQLVGKAFATVKALAGKLLLSPKQGFPEAQRKDLRAQAAG